MQPGSRVNAHLKGSASLLVEVVDDTTGDPVPGWSATLRFERVSFSPREFVLVEPGDDPPAGGLLDGIVPGDFTLLVRAGGRAEGSVSIDGLLPGETRRLQVRLGAPGSITGILRHAGGEPIPRVDVLLLPHEVHPEPPEDPMQLAHWRAQEDMRRWEVQQHAAAATADERGAFRFEGLAPGEYDLSAQVSDVMAAELSGVRVAAGGTAEVVLEAPACAYLSGTCLGPGGTSFEGLSIEIETAGSEQRFFGPGGQLRAEIDGQGGYRVGPAPPGDYAVRLRLPDVARAWQNTSTRSQGAMRALDTVTLVAGENPGHDYDLRADFPGRLSVRVTRGGAPANGLDVRPFLIPLEGEAAGFPRFPTEAAGAALDDDGTAVLGPLLPGNYLLVVEGTGAPALAPGVVFVPAGAESRFAFDATPIRGALTVRDAESGQPLANHPLKLIPASPPGLTGLRLPLEINLQTDAEGRAAAELVSGSYVVFDGSAPAFLQLFAGDLGAELAWDARGPAPAELRLKRMQGAGWPAPPPDGR